MLIEVGKEVFVNNDDIKLILPYESRPGKEYCHREDKDYAPKRLNCCGTGKKVSIVVLEDDTVIFSPLTADEIMSHIHS